MEKAECGCDFDNCVYYVIFAPDFGRDLPSGLEGRLFIVGSLLLLLWDSVSYLHWKLILH